MPRGSPSSIQECLRNLYLPPEAALRPPWEVSGAPRSPPGASTGSTEGKGGVRRPLFSSSSSSSREGRSPKVLQPPRSPHRSPSSTQECFRNLYMLQKLPCSLPMKFEELPGVLQEQGSRRGKGGGRRPLLSSSSSRGDCRQDCSREPLSGALGEVPGLQIAFKRLLKAFKSHQKGL